MNFRKVLFLKIAVCLLGVLTLLSLFKIDMLKKKEEVEAVTETLAMTDSSEYRNSAETILPEDSAWTEEKQDSTENVDNKNKIDYSYIRVLLTNADGGYHFDQVEIELNGKTYCYEEKLIKKRGAIMIMAGNSESKMKLLSAKKDDYVPSYRGGLILRCDDEGIYIVNELLLEDYLYQVVPSEMPASYPTEALKSQAILARTYAAGYIANPALLSYHADLDDTTSFQVYAKQAEKENTNQIVDETKGLVLAASGKKDSLELAEIYYFSTSCGVTTTTEAWNKKKNASESSVFLSNVADHNHGNIRDEEAFYEFISNTDSNAYEKNIAWYRWKYESKTTGKDIMERIRQRFEAQPTQFLSRKNGEKSFKMEEIYDLGELLDIKVTKRAAGGCVSEIQVEGTKADIRVRTEYSVRFVLCNPNADVILQDGSKRQMPTILPSAFFSLSTSKEKTDVVGYTLIGGGFGHGIGMSQNGASKMAEEGMDCEQIVSFFYPFYAVIDIQEMDK